MTGRARALLTAERTALNFLQRLSGIATLTARFVDAAAGRITVLDTRKTTPTLRALEKYAVRCGGGTNHRTALDDGILIKDNHKRLAGGIGPAVRRALAAGIRTAGRGRSRDARRARRGAGRRRAVGAARQLQHLRHPPRRRADRRAGADRDLRRRHARSRCRSSPPPAPTSCRSARSRTRRRRWTSASRSTPLAA